MCRSLRWSLVALLLGVWLCGALTTGQFVTAASAAWEEGGAIPYDGRGEAFPLRFDEEHFATITVPQRASERGTGAAEIRLRFFNNTPPLSATVPPEVKAAARLAADIWEGYIASPVPIVVEIYWQPVSGALGNASIYEAMNFPGAPLPDTSYPHALANALAGRDLVPSLPEMTIRVDSARSDWHFGAATVPRDRLSFIRTVMHEIGHGLGFYGTAEVDDGLGYWGHIGGNEITPRIYDRFVVNGDGASILDTTLFPNPSEALAQQLQSGNLFWRGAQGSAGNRGLQPRIHAPRPWNSSGYDHLDNFSHRGALMDAFNARGDDHGEPDSVTLGMLADMGWTVRAAGDPVQACFPETGECMRGPFGDYWAANGGLAQQGFAISEPFVEISPTDGKRYLTQYFERARFEWHPENQPPYDVLLGLLGREQLQAKYGGDLPPPLPGRPLGEECATFEQTGKQVCGTFLDYWREHGGLAQQGLPLTDLFLETNPTDGKQYPTQYFERARFEYHAEHAGTPNAVLLGLLGREQFLARYPAGEPSEDDPNTTIPPNARLKVTPDVGPPGTLFIAVGSGFPRLAFYTLQIIAQDGSQRIDLKQSEIQIDPSGNIYLQFTLDPATPAGHYVLRILTASRLGTVIAQATFALSGPGGPPARPHLIVVPGEGQAGTTFFRAVGTGFTPNTDYTYRVQSEDRQRTIPQFYPEVRSDADGVLAFGTRVPSDQPSGVYIVEIVSIGPSPQVVAGATLRIVGGVGGP